MSSQVSQKQPTLRAVPVGASFPVGVIDVYRGIGGVGEGRKADAELSQLDVITWRDGRQVEGNRPPLTSLLAACK